MKYTIIVLLFLPLCASAQWRWLGYGNPDGSGGMGPAPLAFGAHDHHFFVSMPEDGILRQDTPVNWVRVNSGIDLTQGQVTSFTSLGAYFFAGLGGHAPAFKTNNDGAQWSKAGGSPIATNGRYLFSSSGTSVYRSEDTGNSWHGVPCPAASGFAPCGSCILAVTATGIYRSTDSGTNWSPESTPSTFSLHAFAVVGTHFFAAGADSTLDSVKYKGLWRSDDSGLHWAWSSLENRSVNALAASDSFLFAGTDSGIYISSDLGSSWRNVTDNIKANTGFNPDVKLLAVVDTLLYAAVNQSGNYNVYRCVTDRPISEMTSPAAVISLPQPPDTIAIFPNPATDVVNIIPGGSSVLGVRVLNLLGEDVLDAPAREETKMTLDLSKLPAGTYFIRLTDPDGRAVVRRVVKQ